MGLASIINSPVDPVTGLSEKQEVDSKLENGRHYGIAMQFKIRLIGSPSFLYSFL